MSTYSIYLVLCILQISTSYFSEARLFEAGCSISVNSDLSDPQPLLLLQNNATEDIKAFPLPHDKTGAIQFSAGQAIDIACPGGSIIINKYNTEKSVIEARCSFRDNFLIEQDNVALKLITCSKIPFHTARYTGKKCAKIFQEIEIGFNINNRFIRHITTCFDKNLQNVLYSQSVISSRIIGYQRNYPRPDFSVGGFYNVTPGSVSNLYSREKQRQTINNILGLSPENYSVIHQSNNLFLSRGHFTPKADFVFGAQQRLTFYYVNVAPQWQVGNVGNWNSLEMGCRRLASSRKLDIIVYTGSFGVTTLPDKNEKHQELYLWKNGLKKGIPVPNLMYKILYEPKSKAGIALISVNNPYNAITNKDIICRDVCDEIKWLSWDRFNVTKGYSYCCNVNDFRKTVTHLPKFKVDKLLR